MIPASTPSPEIRYADPETESGAYYALMRQLRPHLASEAEFTARWGRQASEAYRLIGLWSQGTLVALAGFRPLENMVHGRHLYVDDLVTSEEARGYGHGSALINRLQQEALALGCAKLLLDTPMSNTLAHRFYYRNGLLATALRFSTAIEEYPPTTLRS